eukprot:SM000101S09262  [mRNA]  locus=s101:168294:169127:+ [translate_table: standard]
MTCGTDWLRVFRTTASCHITFGYNTVALAADKGAVDVTSKVKGKFQRITLAGVLYVPHLARNLLPVDTLNNQELQLFFHPQECRILSRDEDVVAVGKRSGGYHWLLRSAAFVEPMTMAQARQSSDAGQWEIAAAEEVQFKDSGMWKLVDLRREDRPLDASGCCD